jgi:hypothetical protein
MGMHTICLSHLYCQKANSFVEVAQAAYLGLANAIYLLAQRKWPFHLTFDPYLLHQLLAQTIWTSFSSLSGSSQLM